MRMICITGDDEVEIQRISVSIQFQMKKLGELRYFLGLDFDNTKGYFSAKISMQEICYSSMEFNCKPVSTPIEINIKFCAHEGNDLEETGWKPYLFDYGKTQHCIRSWYGKSLYAKAKENSLGSSAANCQLRQRNT